MNVSKCISITKTENIILSLVFLFFYYTNVNTRLKKLIKYLILNPKKSFAY